MLTRTSKALVKLKTDKKKRKKSFACDQLEALKFKELKRRKILNITAASDKPMKTFQKFQNRR